MSPQFALPLCVGSDVSGRPVRFGGMSVLKYLLVIFLEIPSNPGFVVKLLCFKRMLLSCVLRYICISVYY